MGGAISPRLFWRLRVGSCWCLLAPLANAKILKKKRQFSNPTLRFPEAVACGHYLGQLRKVLLWSSKSYGCVLIFDQFLMSKIAIFGKFRIFGGITLFWLGLARRVWTIDLLATMLTSRGTRLRRGTVNPWTGNDIFLLSNQFPVAQKSIFHS